MKSASEKTIILLSTGLVILSAGLIGYSGINLMSSNKENKDPNSSLTNSAQFNNPDVLGISSTDESDSSDTTLTSPPPTQPQSNFLAVNPTYIDTTNEPLSGIKPKNFYISSTTTDLSQVQFRLKYEDNTYSDYQYIELFDGVKGEVEQTTHTSIIYKFDKNYTDIEFLNNGNDVKITFVNDPSNTLNKSATNVAYSFEKDYKKRLFANFGINLITREEWGAPSYSDWIPEFSKITRAVIHHTAGSVDMATPANTVKAIYDEHRIRCSNDVGFYPANCDINHTWSDIGYNYLIDPYGGIYEGRAGGNGVIGAHSIPNEGSIGIALLGNFVSTPPTQAALTSLNYLLGAVAFLNDFQITWQGNLLTHKDYLITTQCPGDAFYAVLPRVAEVAEGVRENYYNQPQYRDLIGKLSFGQSYILSNPSIVDNRGMARIYLIPDNIDDQMKLKIKMYPYWGGGSRDGNIVIGDKVVVYVDKYYANVFVSEVGIAIPGIKFSATLP